MRHLLLRLSLGSCVVLCSLTTPAESAPSAKVVPESVQTKDVPGPATLTLDAPPAQGKDLTNTANVFVDTERIAPSSKEKTSVTFSPPRRETAGDAVVEARDAQGEVLAAGRITYVESRLALNPPIKLLLLAIFYALVILVFPFSLMWYDLRKAYKFAHETRMFIIGRAAADGLTAEEL